MRNDREEMLRAMREDLVGLEVDYCFHLRTQKRRRRSFRIVAVELKEYNDIELVGEDRMVLIMGRSAIGYIREGDSWIKEGVLYQHNGEELRIGGRSWTTWFQTGPRISAPW